MGHACTRVSVWRQRTIQVVLCFLSTGSGTQVVRLTGSTFALLSHPRSLHAVFLSRRGK